MKKIFTILIAAITLICLSSCNNGLKTKLDDEQAQVGFLLEFDGKNITLENSSRNIGLDSVQNALKEFKFNVKFTNKDDSSKVISQSGDIVWLSSYLSYISLSKGRWTITITGQIPNVDSKLYGTTDFTVGGREVYFYLTLKISGSAPGSIKFTMPGVGTSKPNVALIPLDKYLDGTYTTEDVIPFNNESSESAYYEEVDTDDISVFSTFIITGIAPGVYYFTVDPIESENPQYTDIATVYPGLTSTGLQTDGKSKLILDLQCGNVPGLEDRTLWFNGGMAYLPGYGSDPNNREVVRPGYLFTGWYDSREAAEFGLYTAIPRDQKFVSNKVLGSDGVYKIANRTLYAGWKEVDTDGLLEQDLYYWSRANGYRVVFKDKLQNNPGDSSTSPKLSIGASTSASYAIGGDAVYILSFGDLYYADYSSLTEDTDGTNSANKLTHTWATGDNITQPHSMESKALFTDSSGEVYLLQLADFYTGSGYIKKFYIAKLNGKTNPQCYATLDIDNVNISFNYANMSIDAFAVSGNMLFITYTESNDVFLEKYNLQSVENDSQEKLAGFEYVLVKDGETVNLTTLYDPYPLVYDEGEPTDYAKIYVRDIYVDGNSVYVLIDENSYTYSGSDKEELVSTGAVVEFDTDLEVQGIYGRQISRPSFYSSDLNVNSHYVDHAYDITAFTGPKKILAVYKRKLVIFDEGMYPYYADDSESPSVKVKRWLSRVTTFDLDKKCIDYAQITNVDILEGSTITDLDISGFSWDN